MRQKVCAVMAADHPLARERALRLRDCAQFPVGLPSSQYGVRHLLDLALIRSSVHLAVAIESDSFEFLRRYPKHERLVTFQIPVGLPDAGPEEGIVSRPVDTRDVPEGRLHLCALRGRTLPVAAAKFAARVEGVLQKLSF